MQIPVLPTRHIVGLALFSLVLGIWIAGNLPLRGERADSRTNLASALHLAELGSYRDTRGDTGWHRREPFLPFLLSGYHTVRKAFGLPVVDIATCLSEKAQLTLPCMQVTVTYRYVNVAILLVASVGVFLLVFWTTASVWPAYAGYFLTACSASLQFGASRLMTDVAAASLMTMVSVLLFALLARRRLWIAIGLGLCLGALTLTKIAFAPFWIPVVATVAAVGLFTRPVAWSNLLLAGVVFVAYALPVGAWMTRNYVLAGTFELVEARAYRVLSIRHQMNQMRWDEYLAGFFYFMPAVGSTGLSRMGVDPESYARYQAGNPNGFRAKGVQASDASLKEVKREWLKAGREPLSAREIAQAVEPRFRSAIYSDPISHLKLTVMLATAMNYPERGLGQLYTAEEGRAADAWSFGVPSISMRFGPLMETIFNGLSTLSIIALPLVLWFGRKELTGLVIVLPVLYSHAAYAGASHFIPRYAEPEIPLRNAALCICLFLLASAVYRKFGARIGRPSGTGMAGVGSGESAQEPRTS